MVRQSVLSVCKPLGSAYKRVRHACVGGFIMDKRPSDCQFGYAAELTTGYVWAAIVYLDSATDYREEISGKNVLAKGLGQFTVLDKKSQGDSVMWLVIAVLIFVSLALLGITKLVGMVF